MSTAPGKVVVNRSMSLDGFVAGPGDAMDWIFGFMAPDGESFLLGDGVRFFSARGCPG